MNDAQVFEFKGNALIWFLVRVTPTSLTVSTMGKRGGEPAKTWSIAFKDVAEVNLSDRVRRLTGLHATYLRPRVGENVMFAWNKGFAGTSEREGNSYYHAAAATLDALAAQRPDLEARIGPPPSALMGKMINVALLLAAAAVWPDFRVFAAALLALQAYDIATSGVLSKSRRLSVRDAASELAARSKAS